MNITPRRLRIVATSSTVALLTIAVGIGAYLVTHRAAASAPARPVVASVVAVRRVAPAPLLVVPVIDASGSMAKSDPEALRYVASNEMLSSLVAARPALARTLVSPVYFGTRAVSGRAKELGPGSLAGLGYRGVLGDTNFRVALLKALPAVGEFRQSESGRSGRAIVVVVTDGAPDMPNVIASPGALWPGIEAAVADIKAAGGEVYLLGFAEDSKTWKNAAQRWRTILGPQNVLLARDAAGLHALYRDLAATALDLGVTAGIELAAGKTATLGAGLYSETLIARVTSLEDESSFLAWMSGEPTSTPVRLAARGEQVILRFPASSGAQLLVENTSAQVPLMVSLTSQTAILRPAPFAPATGAPIDGLLMDLRDGHLHPISSATADPITLAATLTWSTLGGSPEIEPLDLRVLEPGRYEARSRNGARWPASHCRLTVLTRSVAGEIGREDYSIEPTEVAWAALTEPADPFALADAGSVPLNVSIRVASRSATESEASTGAPFSVSAELRRSDGSAASSTWLAADGKGAFRGSLPGTVKDGVVRLTVVGSDGTAISVRDFPIRMRKTSTQLLVGAAVGYAATVGAVLLVLVLAAAAWLLLKPPLAGSLVVKGSGPRPQRFGVLGQRFGVVNVDDASGSERWFVLPSSRNAVRVLKLGLIPCQVSVHRGADVPFRGRTMRLV
jgi:hypothetical protein